MQCDLYSAAAAMILCMQDGGYVWWVDAAFGNFWGFMMGWISWSGGDT